MNNIVVNINSTVFEFANSIFTIEDTSFDLSSIVEHSNELYYNTKSKLTPPSEEDIKILTTKVNQRDKLYLIIREESIDLNERIELSEKDTPEHLLKKISKIIDESSIKDDLVDLEFKIIKDVSTSYFSIYYPEIFFKWINKLSIDDALDFLSRFKIHQRLIFELQIEDDYLAYSSRFAITNKSNNNDLTIPHFSIISSENPSTNLVDIYNPIDFHLIKRGHIECITTFFDKLSILHSIIYLLDIVNIDKGTINARLNGYKTINFACDVNDILLENENILFQITKWTYQDGNITDKLGLARNIISLNIKSLKEKLALETFDAIKSSFKIYQKRNIQEYIQVRNNMSSELTKIIEKEESILSSYVSNFHKNAYTIFSVFITLIILQVISGGNFNGVFSNNVIVLFLAFIGVSFIIQHFLISDIKMRIRRNQKNYEILKKRYQDLLHETDINRILNNDRDYRFNRLIVNKRLSKFSKMWKLVLIVISSILGLMFIFNNINYISHWIEISSNLATETLLYCKQQLSYNYPPFF